MKIYLIINLLMSNHNCSSQTNLSMFSVRSKLRYVYMHMHLLVPFTKTLQRANCLPNLWQANHLPNLRHAATLAQHIDGMNQTHKFIRMTAKTNYMLTIQAKQFFFPETAYLLPGNFHLTNLILLSLSRLCSHFYIRKKS